VSSKCTFGFNICLCQLCGDVPRTDEFIVFVLDVQDIAMCFQHVKKQTQNVVYAL
jgi:hypothetical protein